MASKDGIGCLCLVITSTTTERNKQEQKHHKTFPQKTMPRKFIKKKKNLNKVRIYLREMPRCVISDILQADDIIFTVNLSTTSIYITRLQVAGESIE